MDLSYLEYKFVKMESTIKKQGRLLVSDKTKTIIVEGISYLYVLLFVYAATSKLLDYDKFQLQISKSPIITEFSPILVWLVPFLEILICILLFLNKTKMLGLYGALGLMSLFTAYIYAILNFTGNIPCSCGGVLERMSWDQHLFFNIFFVVLALVAILLQAKTVEKRTL